MFDCHGNEAVCVGAALKATSQEQKKAYKMSVVAAQRKLSCTLKNDNSIWL